MKLTIEPRGTFVGLKDLPTAVGRVWRGVTDAGVEVTVIVAGVISRADADNADLARELRESPHDAFVDLIGAFSDLERSQA